MTDRELRKLSRAELLEMLLMQTKAMEELQEQLAEAEQQLQEQAVQAQDAGSIAEAALQLGGVFEAAQRSADLYLASIRKLEEDTRRKQEEAERLCARTRARCRAMEETARKKCEEIVSRAKNGAEKE